MTSPHCLDFQQCWVVFLVYIDELAQLLMVSLLNFFADDVKVYLQIVDVMDASKLQCALDIIVELATKWQLQVSVNKCNMLSIGRIPFATEYYICDSVLPSDYECRDLGIMVRRTRPVTIIPYQ